MQFLSVRYWALLAVLWVAVGASARAEANSPRQRAGFVENRGQLRDSEGRSRPDLRYVLSTPDGAVFLRAAGLSYVFSQATENGERTQQRSVRADVEWIGANPNPVIRHEATQPGVMRFFLPGAELETRSYGRVVYEELYPNIDLVYYTTQSGLKYDFIVKPGGNPNDIRLRYQGFSGVNLTREGQLQSATALGKVEEAAPVTFSLVNGEKQAVASSYALANGTLSFRVGAYDRQATLVIDPLTRLWASNYGGTTFDRVHAVALDGQQNVIVAGATASVNFPVTAGALFTTYGDQQDAFVAQFSPAGALNWATFYGGSSLDQAYGVGVDGSNRINVVGYTTSSNFPLQNPLISPTAGGGGDGFIFQLNADGTRNWATYFGGASNDYLAGVAVQANGEMAIAGRSFSTGLATAGAAQVNKDGNRDAIICRVNPNGALIWATYLGGSLDDQALAVSLAPNGDVVAAGVSSSTSLATAGVAQATSGGGNDAWVSRYSSAGARQWTTYVGGSGNDVAQALVADAAGNVFVSGYTSSLNFPTSNAFQATSGGLSDGFVTGVAANGQSLLMSSYLGGNGTDQVFAIARVQNNLYVSGASNSSNFQLINPNAVDLPFQAGNNGFLDIFLTKIDLTANTRSWSLLYGGSTDDGPRGLAANATGRLALGGYTNSPNIPLFNSLPNQAAPSLANDDGMVIVFDDPAAEPCVTFAVTTLLSSPRCVGDTDGFIVVTNPQGANFRYSLAGTVTRPEQESIAFENLPGGVYTVTARNTAVENCSFSATNQILTNPTAVIVNGTSTPFDCGFANGRIDVTASGGAGDYRFDLISPSNVPLALNAQVTFFDGLSQTGDYTVVGRDANGCESSTTVNLTQNTPFNVTAVGAPTTCGLNNGNVRVNTPIVGAAPPVTYELLDNATMQVVRPSQLSPDFLNVPGTVYVVRATDGTGCSAFTDPLTIATSVNNLQVTNVTVDPIVCNGGQTTMAVQVAGAVGPFTYTLAAGIPPVITGSSGGTLIVINNVPAGNYTLTVSDNNGCSIPTPVTGTISQPTPLTVSVTAQQSDCATGQQSSINVVPSGGTQPYLVSLNGGAFSSQTIFTSLAPGDYTVQVRDGGGCLSAIDTRTINPSNDVSIQTAQGNGPLCNGQANGSIDVLLAGGTQPFIYMLDGVPQGDPTAEPIRAFENLAPGVYQIMVQDANDCFASRQVTVPNTPQLVITGVEGTSPTFCGGIDGTLTVNATGGTGALNYQIREGSFVSDFQPDAEFIALPANFYTIVVEDVNLCRAETTFALNDIDSPELLSVLTSNPLCSNDPALNATGQIIINTSTPVSPVFYSINGLVGPFQPSTTGSYTFAGITAGSYSVVVSTSDDLLGCKAFFGPATLTAPAPIIVTNVQVTQPRCGASPTPGSITLTATGGSGELLYGVQGEGFSPSRTITGLYPRPNGIPVQVRDQNGCTVTGGNFFLFNPSGLTLPPPIITATTCGGGQGRVRVTPTGGVLPRSYYLNGQLQATNSNTFFEYANLTGGIYDIEVRDAAGCRAQTRVIMSDLAVVSVNTTAPACGAADGVITLEMSGEGPYSYSFTGRAYSAVLANGPVLVNGSATGQDSPIAISGLRPGVYEIQIRDESDPGMCVLTQTVRLFNTGGPTIVATLSQDRTCHIVNGVGAGGSITVYTNGLVQQIAVASPTVMASQVVAIGPGTVFTTVVDNTGDPLAEGTYNIFVVGQNGCISDGGSETITQPSLILIQNVLVTQPSCDNGSNGRIEVLAEGGNTLEYSIDNGITWQSSNVFQNLNSSANPITVRVREAGLAGCGFTWPYTVQITNQTGLQITGNPIVTQPRCFGESNGTIAVAVTGGVGPYTYLLDGEVFRTSSALNNTYTGLRTGTYLVRVEDSRGCGDERSVFVDQPALIVPAVGTVIQPTNCRGGEITTLTATGGDGGPYFFSLYDAPIVPYTPPPFTDLSIGTYRIVATDNQGCKGETLYNLTGTGVPRLAIHSFTGRNVSCFGADNGELRAQIYAPAADLAGGFVSFTLNNAAPIDPTLNPVPVIGDPNFGMPYGVVPPDGEILLTNVPPGTYTLRVRNFSAANACATRANLFIVRITQPNPIIINDVLVQQPNCTSRKLGRIEVVVVPDASREVEYSIDNGLTWQRSNIFAEVRPSNINLIDPPAPADPITLYRVSVRDVNNPACMVTWSTRINIVNPSGLFLIDDPGQPALVRNETCAGASDAQIRFNVPALLTTNPGVLPIRYYLNGNLVRTHSMFSDLDFNVSDLTAGTYELRVVDNLGCEDVKTVTVGIVQTFTTSFVPTNPSTCGGTNGRISLTLSGGSPQREVVLLRNGVQQLVRQIAIVGPAQASTNFNNLSAGFYQLVVRNVATPNAVCAETLTVVLSDPGAPAIARVNTTAASNAICTNGSAEIVISGGGPNLQYALLTGNQLVTDPAVQYQSMRLFPAVPSGTYTAVVRSGVIAPYCFSYYTFTVGCSFTPTREQAAAEAASLENVSVYPNPNRGAFSVRFSSDRDDLPARLTVLDLNGRRLLEQNLTTQRGMQEVPVKLDNVAAGLYLVRIEQGDRSQSVKIVVE